MNENDVRALSRRDRAAGRRLARALDESRLGGWLEDRPGCGAQLLLAAFDGTPAARVALAYAAGLAGRERAYLRVIVPPSGFWRSLFRNPGVRPDSDPCRATRLIEAAEAVLDGCGVRRRISVCSVAGAYTLEEFAESDGADAIVVPRPRHWRIGRWRAGWLIRHANCPVIVVG
jgi:nucleotide-binding universal stress UspA family protein